MLDLESADGSADCGTGTRRDVVPTGPSPIVEAVRNVIADAARGTWILALDPDERVTPGLAARAAPRFDAPRRRRGGRAPDELRLRLPGDLAATTVRAAAAEYRRTPSLAGLSEALPEVREERMLRLPPRDELGLVHDRNRNIPEALDRVRRYAPAQAKAMIDAGQVFTARRMLVTLGEKLYRHFVQARALRDGVPASCALGFSSPSMSTSGPPSGISRVGNEPRRTTACFGALDLALEAAHRLARALVSPACC